MGENINSFEQFNSTNEGLFSIFGKKENDLDYLIKKIIEEVKTDFDVSKLIFVDSGRSAVNKEDIINGFRYVLFNGDTVRCDGTLVYLNEDNISYYVSDKYIRILWDFFTDQYNKYKQLQQTKKNDTELLSLKNKYSKYKK